MSDPTSDGLLEADDFKSIYKDWQAVRIIRDNYFDVLKMFYPLYAWFSATLIGVCGYVVNNHPFAKVDIYLIGWIGIVLILIMSFGAAFVVFYAQRSHTNIVRILERTSDAAFADKLLNYRISMVAPSLAGIGMLLGLFTWVYIIFFYYVEHF